MAVEKPSTLACDLSENGMLRICGTGVHSFLDIMLAGSLEGCQRVMGASVSPILSAEGEVLDMLLVFRTGDDEYLLMCTAGNTEEVFEWLDTNSQISDDSGLVFPDVTVEDQSEAMAALVISGKDQQRIYDELLAACQGNLLFISCNFAEGAYGVAPDACHLLFTPKVLAGQIGEFLNEYLELEAVDLSQLHDILTEVSLFDPLLQDAQYRKPAELGIEGYLRADGNYVGARALA